MRIIFHVGAGKTGTTSIQMTMRHNQESLKQQNILYLGLMLEYAYQKQYEWQAAAAYEKFHTLSDDVAVEQALDILNKTIAEAASHGVTTMIWSNETFFERYSKILSIIKSLKADGHDVQVVAYVRNYDSWIRSAYVQWGLSHKTYKGDIQPFSEWFQKRDLGFYNSLVHYMENDPENIVIRNMDAHKDVVADFFNVCGINDDSIHNTRANESPSNEELFLRALFNARYEQQVLPARFNKLVFHQRNKNRIGSFKSASEYMETYMPSEEDMAVYFESVKNDREQLNMLLERLGESKISDTVGTLKSSAVDSDKLVLLLAEIVIDQSIAINKLMKEQSAD